MAALSKKSEIDRISTMNNLLLLDGAGMKKQLAHYLIIERENILLHPKTLPLLANRFHVRICKDRRRPVTRPQNSIVNARRIESTFPSP
jgi:hypothetical protein